MKKLVLLVLILFLGTIAEAKSQKAIIRQVAHKTGSNYRSGKVNYFWVNAFSMKRTVSPKVMSRTAEFIRIHGEPRNPQFGIPRPSVWM